MEKTLSQKLEEAAQLFNKEMNSEISSSNCDEETKDLVEQLSSQVFHTFREINKILVEEFNRG